MKRLNVSTSISCPLRALILETRTTGLATLTGVSVYHSTRPLALGDLVVLVKFKPYVSQIFLSLINVVRCDKLFKMKRTESRDSNLAMAAKCVDLRDLKVREPLRLLRACFESSDL